MCCFETSVQLVPKFYSHLSCSLLELKVIPGLLKVPGLKYDDMVPRYVWYEEHYKEHKEVAGRLDSKSPNSFEIQKYQNLPMFAFKKSLSYGIVRNF